MIAAAVAHTVMAAAAMVCHTTRLGCRDRDHGTCGPAATTHVAVPHVTSVLCTAAPDDDGTSVLVTYTTLASGQVCYHSSGDWLRC
ncbi:hypothetical protein PVAP13_4NG337566 [Panicum virgatum]|uniref:Secreted protein n=1 Tax=Panicum virgatum TaxID=38727 RepID=A0A8T0TI60_PANVG|nr:hypothetical protein PVAP13_4NG337566 [Panicum virgatum]